MSFSSTSHCNQSYLAGGVCVAVAGGVAGCVFACGCTGVSTGFVGLYCDTAFTICSSVTHFFIIS
jgi:hypothetical protein